MKSLLLTAAAVFFSWAVFAQSNPSRLTQSQLRKIKRSQITNNAWNPDFQYDREFNVGGRLNTNGWSGYLEYEKRSGEATHTLFQFEFGEVKHPKEDKQAKTKGVDIWGYPYSGHAYVYGKQNIFYQANLGIGQRRLVGGKGTKNGVEVSAVYMGGFSLGLVKPYLLELQDSTGGSSYQKYTPENANTFLNVNNILGGPGLGKGWNEVKLVPGLYARLGMRFDWAEFNEFVSAIEVGLNAQLYSRKIEIMVQNPGKQFFYGAYVSLIFGKRW